MKLGPWIGAAVVAAVLSLLWGALVQWRMTPKHERLLRGYPLGVCEGIIFTMTFAGFGVIGAAWLGFKVASKWKSWSLMFEALKEAGKKELDKEIDTQYHRFLVGTAGNIVIGLAAAAIGYALGGSAFS